jgi:hypothetical protein
MVMSWKKIVGGLAPTIATALGGPLAGTATKYLANSLLGKDNATEDELAAAISMASPEQLGKLRKIDNEFKQKMRELDIDLERIAVEDRKSARDLAQSDMRPQIALSTLFVAGYFAILWLLFSGTIVLGDNIRDMANILLGVLTSGIPMILRFWFGGSPQDEAHMHRIYNSVPHK